MAKSPSNINPNYKRKPIPEYSKNECLEGIANGNTKLLSYVISKAESYHANDQQFVRDIIIELKPNTNVRKLAISGSPGVGKSTFINSFGAHLIRNKKKIAILPVDPSSHISHGSILGDKTRMEDLVNLDGAYIKPMASALALGGLAPSTAVASMLCERSHFDYIIMETVGVGQSEYEARHLVDMFILLLQPGGGDDLQGIKRGIMEMADMMIITKADGSLLSNAEFSFKAYKNAMKLMLPNSYNWSPEVFIYSSLTGDGNDDVLEGIENYYKFMTKDDSLLKLRHKQSQYHFNKEYKNLMLSQLLQKKDFKLLIDELQAQLNSKEIIPLQALNILRKKLEELL